MSLLKKFLWVYIWSEVIICKLYRSLWDFAKPYREDSSSSVTDDSFCFIHPTLHGQHSPFSQLTRWRTRYNKRWSYRSINITCWSNCRSAALKCGSLWPDPITYRLIAAKRDKLDRREDIDYSRTLYLLNSSKMVAFPFPLPCLAGIVIIFRFVEQVFWPSPPQASLVNSRIPSYHHTDVTRNTIVLRYIC